MADLEGKFLRFFDSRFHVPSLCAQRNSAIECQSQQICIRNPVGERKVKKSVFVQLIREVLEKMNKRHTGQNRSISPSEVR